MSRLDWMYVPVCCQKIYKSTFGIYKKIVNAGKFLMSLVIYYSQNKGAKHSI